MLSSGTRWPWRSLRDRQTYLCTFRTACHSCWEASTESKAESSEKPGRAFRAVAFWFWFHSQEKGPSYGEAESASGSANKLARRRAPWEACCCQPGDKRLESRSRAGSRLMTGDSSWGEGQNVRAFLATVCLNASLTSFLKKVLYCANIFFTLKHFLVMLLIDIFLNRTFSVQKSMSNSIDHTSDMKR